MFLRVVILSSVLMCNQSGAFDENFDSMPTSYMDQYSAQAGVPSVQDDMMSVAATQGGKIAEMGSLVSDKAVQLAHAASADVVQGGHEVAQAAGKVYEAAKQAIARVVSSKDASASADLEFLKKLELIKEANQESYDKSVADFKKRMADIDAQSEHDVKCIVGGFLSFYAAVGLGVYILSRTSDKDLIAVADETVDQLSNYAGAQVQAALAQDATNFEGYVVQMVSALGYYSVAQLRASVKADKEAVTMLYNQLWWRTMKLKSFYVNKEMRSWFKTIKQIKENITTLYAVLDKHEDYFKGAEIVAAYADFNDQLIEEYIQSKHVLTDCHVGFPLVDFVVTSEQHIHWITKVLQKNKFASKYPVLAQQLQDSVVKMNQMRSLVFALPGYAEQVEKAAIQSSKNQRSNRVLTAVSTVACSALFLGLFKLLCMPQTKSTNINATIDFKIPVSSLGNK